MNNRFKKLIIFILLLSSKLVVGNGYIGSNASYDKCKGVFDFKVGLFNYFSTGDDDWLSWAKISYKNSSNNWVEIMYLHDLPFTGDQGIISGYSSHNIRGRAKSGFSFPNLGHTGSNTVHANYNIAAYREDDNDNDKYWTHILVCQLPSDINVSATGATEWKIEGGWADRHDDSDNEVVGFEDTYNLSVQTITAPSVLNASQNQCGQVELSWTAPTQFWENTVTCGNYGTYSYQTKRDGSNIDGTQSTTSKTHSGLAAGSSFNFTVSTLWKPFGNNHFSLWSSSTSASGSTKGAPEAPSWSIVTTDRCDQKILLNWDFSGGENPTSFTIDYSSTNSFATYTSINGLTGTSRSYLFTPTSPNTNYYFRIKAINNCNISSAYSSTETGRAEGTITAATSVQAAFDSTQQVVRVSWVNPTGNAAAVTEFKITRIQPGQANVDYQVPANSLTTTSGRMQFTDENIQNCVTYKYQVRPLSACNANGAYNSTTSVSPELSIFQNISASLINLKVSKGYYSNRVQLAWNTDQQVALNTYEIWRKIAGSAADSIKIATVLGGINEYNDETAVSGFLYQYFVIGKLNCVGVNPSYTNAITDIGYKSPSGTVSGRITYSGGFSLNGAKVIAERNNPDLSNPDGYSLSTNGTSQYVEVNNSASLPFANDYTIEMWVRAKELGNDFTLLHKSDGTTDGGIHLYYKYIPGGFSKIRFEVLKNNADYGFNIASPFILDTFVQITIVRSTNPNRLSLYVNGELKGSVLNPGFTTFSPNTQKLTIGAKKIGTTVSDYFKGNIDDLRIWGYAKTAIQVKRDYGRLVSPSSPNLLLYLSFDENLGTHNKVYDQAFDFNQQQPRENHGTIYGGATWSNIVPGSNLLGYLDYSDENGYYTISNIRYLGSGETFKIVPSFESHKFGPDLRNLFIGEGASIQSDIDFLDSSSFEFKGRVLYGDDLNNTSLMYNPSPGVNVYIDGNIVVQDGAPLTTDAAGEFNIRVPIGEHTISVGKQYHTFLNAGKWPLTQPKYNFQQDVLTRVNFIDTTKIILTGRIVGGPVEFNKPYGLTAVKSKNNIGKANLTFSSNGAGAKSYSTQTNTLTGEYQLRVFPLIYNVTAQLVNNNDNITLGNAGNLGNLNLTTYSAFDTTTFYDTTYTQDSCSSCYFLSDTNKVNVVFPYEPFRKSPILYISKTNNVTANNFNGSDSVLVTSTIKIATKNTDGSFKFGYPIFEQGKIYRFNLFGFERYINYDGSQPVTQQVPYQGYVQIKNDLKSPGSDEKFQLDSSGKYTYAFIAGTPNTVYTAGDTLSFTSKFEAYLYPDNQFLFGTPWLTSQGRAVIIGSAPKSGGFDFLTVGPTTVDFVVRRPPGSSSVATLSKNTVYTSEETNVAIGSTDTKIGAVKRVGLETSVTSPVVPGSPLTTTTTVAVAEQEALANTVDGGKNGWVKVNGYSTNFAISTQPISGLPGHVASLGDVYVGKAENYRFSDVLSLEIIPSTLCGNPGISCPLPAVNGNSLAILTARGYSKEGIKTSFAYSEYEIINNIIPLLERKRNEAMADSTKYHSNIPKSHPLYGSNNDDPLWLAQRTQTERITTEPADTSGPSYRLFYSKKPANKSLVEWDEVRKLNQDIRLWKEAISENEKVKYQVNNNRSKYNNLENFSFDSRTKITKSYTTEEGEGKTKEWEATAGVELESVTYSTVNGAGTGIKASTTTLGGRGGTEQSVTTNGITWEYTLEDNDLYDRFTIDVYDPKDGGSPVFINKGGRSRCPYEGPQYANYYDPAVDFISSHTTKTNRLIADGTVEIEDPRIEVIGASIKENVPAGSAATFTIKLKNNSNHKLEYQLGVAEESNPNGAIVKIDGLDPFRLYNMDSQMVVIKVVTIERGPESYVYDDIEVEFESPCEERIKKSVKLSARFTPTCSEIDVKSPTNNWVVNTNSNNRLPIEVQNYDINFSYFNNFEIQYKPKSSDIWKTLQRFEKSATSNSIAYIPRNKGVTDYVWDTIDAEPDGLYEIRAMSNCLLDSAGFNKVSVISTSREGIIDLTRPRVFGTPSPGDGILSPNDDISIQFTEDVDNAAMRFDNFEVSGIPNSATLKHNAMLFFDGLDDRAEIRQAPNLANKSFTFSFYATPKRLGQKQVFLSQGTANNAIEIGLDANNRFYAAIGGSSVWATRTIQMNQKAVSPNYSDTIEMNCFTVSYNKELETILLYINNERVNDNIGFVSNYNSSGKINLGCDFAQSNTYRGQLTDFRIFNKALTNAEIILNMNKRASISDAGLLHNWLLNEGTDTILLDKIRRRELVTIGAQWDLAKKGRGLQLNVGGDNVLGISSGTYPITKEMDMTLEFWFKTTQQAEQVIVSTGAPEYQNINTYFEPYWQIKMLQSGLLQVGFRSVNLMDSFLVNNTSYNDGVWHHFAMTIGRTTNLNTYIDGKLQTSKTATIYPSFASSALTIGGLRKAPSPADNTTTIEKRFVGNFDEFRLWDLSRTAEQILTNKNNNLTGKELGLVCYLPFETYKNNANQLIIDSTLENRADSGKFAYFYPNSNQAEVNTISPVIKMDEPITNYDVTYLTNKDKIILIPEVAPHNIENTTLNITVSRIQDLYGNLMPSKKTWIAYVDKNQMKWDENEFEFEKLSGQSLTFTNEIINSGGENKSWSVGNLPSWITASPSNGILAPNSSKKITFTIDPNINIGIYEQDLQLVTNFGFNDKMFIKLKVYANTPATWTVNPSLYNYSMNVVGQVKIGNTFSTNPDDKLAAFVNGQCRGIANLQYFNQADKYLAYLTIHSNVTAGEIITYKIWNATEGKIHSVVVASDASCDTFRQDAIKGTFITPVVFTATDKLTRDIVLKTGWNWISFNLNMPNLNLNALNGLPGVLTSLRNPTHGNRLRVQGLFLNDSMASQKYAEYDSVANWVGQLKAVDYLNGFRYYSANPDTVTIIGNEIDPTFHPIKVIPGWNWIGFLSQRNIGLADALGNYDAKHGDIIKSQAQFSMYVNQIGWVGTLNTLIPNQSYMLFSTSANSSQLVYPRAAMFGKTNSTPNNDELFAQYGIQPNLFNHSSGIVAEVNLCEQPLQNNDFILMAEVNHELRGVASLQNIKEKHQFYLTVFGNTDKEQVDLFLYNTQSKQKYPISNQFTSQPNLVTGNFYKPTTLNIAGAFDCRLLKQQDGHGIIVYPIPFKDELNIEINTGYVGTYQVDVFDMQGRHIISEEFQKTIQNNKFKFNTTSLPKGSYLIRVKSNAEVFNQKLIK